MIYFLVNNNYHLELDVKLAKQLNGHDLGLIQVPYSLNIIHEHPLFKRITCFNDRLHTSLKRLIFKPFDILKVKKIVDEKITVNKVDILLVHTELDLINQYIIQKFYENQARVFLLEDGTSTMGPYNLPVEEVSIENKIKSFVLRKVYNFKYSSIVKLGNQILPIMADSVFSGSIVNFGHQIRRNIPLYRLKQQYESLDLKHEQGALFLSQALYCWYLTELEYIAFLDNVLVISKCFSPFYLKFHPSEREKVKKSIELLVKNKYPEILIVQDDLIAEKLIEKLRVKQVITINSSAALSLTNKGITPIFLNQLFYNEHPSFEGEEFSNFLNSINCNFPKAIAEVKPGYVAFDNCKEDTNDYTIKEILNFK